MAELDNFTVQKLITAIETLTDQLGRGIGGNSKGVFGKNGASTGSTVLDRVIEKTSQKFEALQAMIDAGNKLSAKQNEKYKKLGQELDEYKKSIQTATEAQNDLSDATDQSTSNQKRQSDAVKYFGQSLRQGGTSIGTAFDRLSENLKTSDGFINKALFGFAAGVGFVLTSMEDFAKNASEVGAFADLGAFRVGSIQQAKVMSGLGESFIKAIAESKGGFKALGDGSQDAVENLSALSRGLRNGAKFAPLLGLQLGKEFRDDLTRASTAVSRLGLSAEDQADLTGTIVNSVAMSGKRGNDAIKEVAKQFRATAENARTLSDAFGISAKDIIASVKEFRDSVAGRATALEGGTGEGAGNILPLIKQLALNSDPQKQALIAKAISEGDYAGAAANTDQYSRQNLDILYKAVQNAGGGADRNKLAKAMQDSADEFTDASRDASRRQALYYNPEYAAPAVAAGELGQRLKLGKSTTEADKDKNTFMTSEADNIKTMNQLNTALDLLRGSIIGLTGVMVGILGMLAPLVAGAITSGLVSGKSMKELAMGVKDIAIDYADKFKGVAGTASGAMKKFAVELALAGEIQWNIAKDNVKKLWTLTSDYESMSKAAGGFTDKLIATSKELWNKAGTFIGDNWKTTKEYVSGLATKAGKMWEEIGGFSGATGKLKDNIVAASQAVGSRLANVAGVVKDQFVKVSSAVWNSVGGTGGFGTALKDFGTKIGGYAVNAGKSLIAMGASIWSTVIPALIAMARSAWASVIGGFGSLGKFLGPVTGWFSRIVPVLGRVGGFFATWGTRLLPMLGGAFEILAGPIGWLIGGATLLYEFWDDIVDVSKELWKGFTGLVDWFTGGISAIWDGITGVISSAFGGLVDMLSSGASAIWGVITAPFTGLFDWLGDSWLGRQMGFGSDSKSEDEKSADATPTDTKSASATPTDTKSASATPSSANPTNTTANLLQNQTPGQISGTITQDQFATIATPNGVNRDFGNLAGANNTATGTGTTAQNTSGSNLQNTITPEMLAKAIGYLQSMANDLEAIRSNTRASDSGGTVRMS